MFVDFFCFRTSYLVGNRFFAKRMFFNNCQNQGTRIRQQQPKKTCLKTDWLNVHLHFRHIFQKIRETFKTVCSNFCLYSVSSFWTLVGMDRNFVGEEWFIDYKLCRVWSMKYLADIRKTKSFFMLQCAGPGCCRLLCRFFPLNIFFLPNVVLICNM